MVPHFIQALWNVAQHVNAAMTAASAAKAIADSASEFKRNKDIESSKLNINVATASDLAALPGIGRVLAERIVTHRKTYGPFTTVEELLNVPGIGATNLESIRYSIRAR